jgi:hypothetical protein
MTLTVAINNASDKMLNLTVAEECSHTRAWVSIYANPILSATPHLPSTGDILDSSQPSDLLCPHFNDPWEKDTSIPHRVHTCTVFHNVGVALKDLTSLVDILSCLFDMLKGEQITVSLLSSVTYSTLALYYLHKSGFVESQKYLLFPHLHFT